MTTIKNRILTYAFTCVSAVLLMTPQAQAQCPSPAALANPLILFAGAPGSTPTVWTFRLDGQVLSAQFASAGQLTASIRAGGPPFVGLLSVTQSSTYQRLETDAGYFSVNSDCSGGTLTFNLSSRPIQFDFWFDEGFGEIRFVSTTAVAVVSGTARRFTLLPTILSQQ
jgi:hypothetical protein